MKLKINTYKTPIFCMFYLVVTFSILDTIKFMVQYHPHQNVYFNLISKYPNKRIKLNYELDYWGLSYKQALEYILKYDLSDKIYVKSSNSPGIINAENFVKSEKRRLIFVKSLNEAQYYISNYRWHSNEYSFGENIYSILVNGENIMSVIYLKN